MIKLLLFAILFVIAWPLALLIALGWVALVILRMCFGITVLGIKAVAATGIGGAMAGSALSARLRNADRPVPWSPTGPRLEQER
jgi:hypothetical protein